MEWTKEFSAAITICDLKGKITYMNDKAAAVFDNDGGRNLIGKYLSECHSQASNDKINEIIETGNTNVYTIEKKGKKKLIYQSPSFENNQITGIIEISFEIPMEMPHHIRE